MGQLGDSAAGQDSGDFRRTDRPGDPPGLGLGPSVGTSPDSENTQNGTPASGEISEFPNKNAPVVQAGARCLACRAVYPAHLSTCPRVNEGMR